MTNQYTYKPPNKDELIKIYINSDRSMKEAAGVLNISVKTIWKALDYYGLKAKSKGAPGKRKKVNYSPERLKYLEWKENNKKLKSQYGFIPRYPEKEIRNLFEKYGPIARKIAGDLGCGYRYVERLLVAYKLVEPYKKRGETHIYPQLRDRAWFTEQVKTKSLREIAKDLGCSYSAIMYTSNKFNIRSKINYNRVGSESHSWKGGKRAASSGGEYTYIYTPGHPKATKSGYVMEHRLIAEKKIERLLEDYEDVHHVNGDKKDNRPENLQVLSRKEHSRVHFDAVKEVSRLKKLLDEHDIPY